MLAAMDAVPRPTATAPPRDTNEVVVPSILDALPPDFFSTHWRREPLLVRGALPTIASLVSEEELDAFERDYFAAPAAWRNGSIGVLGTTSFIANAECINEHLALLCDQLRAEFQWPHGEIAIARNRAAQSWVTSGPHFDQVDNFITLAVGRKQWRLWPTRSVGADEKRRRVLRLPHYGESPIPPEQTDLVDVIVEPGDLLYVPLFWGHSVCAHEPGVMYSINLKALLPSQVLLRGMADELAELPDDSAPLAIPAEVPDWDAYLEKAMSDAFATVARRLAPAPSDGKPRASTIAAAGLSGHASKRHAQLVPPRVVDESLAPSPHIVAVDAVLEQTRLDLRPLTGARPLVELGGLADTFAAIHLHRFLALISLGPQAWWSSAHREGWTKSRELLDVFETTELLAAARDPLLVELTTTFRDALLAFNRRHALAALARWTDRLHGLAAHEVAAGVPTFADAGCNMAAEPSVTARVAGAIRDVESTWPGFGEAFGDLIHGVVTVRNVEQARQASRRPRIAVVEAGWAQDEMALALSGELARVAAQLVERIGTVIPHRSGPYRGTWSSSPSELSRAAALLVNARYLVDTGDVAEASRSRRLAAALLEAEDAAALTPLGVGLLTALTTASDGNTGDVAPLPAAEVVRRVEGLEPEDVREFVEGLTVRYARFRWSNLGVPDDGAVAMVAGMDCGLPPWLVP